MSPPTHEEPMSESLAYGRLSIDLGAIARNYRALAAAAPGARCAGVVKADAYGLGAMQVAPVLADAGCTEFFVALLDEGLALRSAVPGARIYVLNGLPPGSEARCAEAGLVPVLNSFTQIKAWAALCQKTGGRLPAVIQLDSGMSRLGLGTAEVEVLLAEPSLLAAMELVLVMSHLAAADEPDHAANGAQLAAFRALAGRFGPVPLSLSNTAGIGLGPAYHFDLVRPGAGLYGLQTGPRAVKVEPVAALWGRVCQIREIEAGAGIGYGHSAISTGPMRLATLGVGYADGWPRSLSNTGAAFWGATRLPIVGRVSMDSVMVDISGLDVTDLVEGDFVALFGPGQSVDGVARAAGTIGYEMLTSLSRRYERSYRV